MKNVFFFVFFLALLDKSDPINHQLSDSQVAANEYPVIHASSGFPANQKVSKHHPSHLLRRNPTFHFLGLFLTAKTHNLVATHCDMSV